MEDETAADVDDAFRAGRKMHLSAAERTAVDFGCHDIQKATSLLQTCSGKYTDLACVAADEWTGGVAEFNNGTHLILT